MSKGKLAILIVLLVLLIDQCVKFWIKTHMIIGEEFNVAGNWFIIHFTENNGMAFGIEFFGKAGKYILSIFRIAAVVVIGFYIFRMTKREIKTGYVVAVALIMAGALGNIIDSALYGIIFNNSYNQLASFMPAGGGYAGFLQGRVVDMLYFPVIQGHWPAWSPYHPTEEFTFFRPIFNIADSAITSGMALILLFYRKTLQHEF
jgi:signal peptidase II